MKTLIQRWLSYWFPVRHCSDLERVFGDSAIRLKGKGR